MEKLKEEMAPMNTELGPLPTENTATKGPELKTIGFYRQALVPHLSPQIFTTNPARLGWYAFCGLGALACFFAIVTLPLTWPVKLLLGLGLGFCNGTMAFVCHELYHGAIVKSQKVQDFLGFFGAVPFFVSPTFWRYWHNRLHHGSTQQLIQPPIQTTSKTMAGLWWPVPCSVTLLLC
jgi:fatty acid desaturase